MSLFNKKLTLFTMFSFLIFHSFSEDKNGIFKKHFRDNIIQIDVSGSSKQYINGSRQLTKPIYAIDPIDKRYDWCSNCGRTYDEKPWITFSAKDSAFKVIIRCGCCYDDGCCCEDVGYCARCCLFSWSLQISNDNKSWTEVHRVDRDYEMARCNEKTYKLDKEFNAKFIRLIQNEPCPGDPPCIAINKMEIYGELISNGGAGQDDFVSFHDDDDDVSIIGHISKNGRI